MKRENENENENEEYYVLLLVLFVENVENVKSALELFGAAAGLERGDPRFVCILACDSSETGFLDGRLPTFTVVVVHQFSVLWSRKICENVVVVIGGLSLR